MKVILIKILYVRVAQKLKNVSFCLTEAGARQVGKTWLMKEFGKRYYNTHFIIILMKRII